MDIFILVAGKPAHGISPSALKTIAHETKAINWKINCFKSIKNLNRIHLLGEYKIEYLEQMEPKFKAVFVYG